MTNADDTVTPDDTGNPDDAHVPEEPQAPDDTNPRSEESRASSGESEPPEAPTRRGFLAALAGLGLVHFHVLRVGAPVPTPRPVAGCGAIVGGQVTQDAGCGVQDPFGPIPDGDCGLSAGGGSPISQDGACNKAVPGDQGHASDGDCGIQGWTEVSQDNACNGQQYGQTVSDGDCGKFPTDGGVASGDEDCGLTNTSGLANADSHCGKPLIEDRDLDCGKPAPLSSFHQDASCGKIAGEVHHWFWDDKDCGKAGGMGFWTDSDCGLPDSFWGNFADNAHA